MAWRDLISIYEEAAADHAAEQAAPLVACPQHGDPLLSGPAGELYCPFGGERFDGGEGGVCA